MIAPAAWVPTRLPLWGAILGLIAGSLGAFVLNLPLRILDEAASVPVRAVAVVFMAVVYYLLWMVVRRLSVNKVV
jgi:ABC-type dipeptide/oligopeptide/nickel transport system permease subunit